MRNVTEPPPEGQKLIICYAQKIGYAEGTTYAWFDGFNWRNWYNNYVLSDYYILSWELLKPDPKTKRHD